MLFGAVGRIFYHINIILLKLYKKVFLLIATTHLSFLIHPVGI